jgi:aldose 1-epimerase
MPFAEGWHPFFGFNVPVDRLFLKFSADRLILVDQRMIPTGETVRYDHFNQLKKIGDTLFDSCFKLKAGQNLHTTELYNPEKDLTVMLWQETGPKRYNFLQVYIPPSRQSIALEPMTCNINAFNNGEGLQILEPGECYEASYGIRIK